MDTSIELKFGDGTYRFWLSMKEIVAIEAESGHDRFIGEIWTDLDSAMDLSVEGDMATPVFMGHGTWHARDIAIVIRHGLIGGGEGLVDGAKLTVSPLDASRLVQTYVHGRPFVETLPVAWYVLRAAVHGVQTKKKEVTKAAAKARSAKGKSSRNAASSA